MPLRMHEIMVGWKSGLTDSVEGAPVTLWSLSMSGTCRSLSFLGQNLATCT